MIKKIFLVVSTLILAFTIVGAPASAVTQTEGEDYNSYTTLSKKEAKEYIKLASESDLYKNNVSDKKIKDAEAILVSAGENAPEDVIIVNGNVNGKESNAVQVVISVNTKEVVKLSHIEATGEELEDTYKISAYDNNGQLRLSSEGTIGDLQNGDVEVKQEEVEGPKARVSDEQIWWACQFSSLVLCMGAAGVNFLLGLACRAAFKLAAC